MGDIAKTYCVFFLLLLHTPSMAADCFIAKENGVVIKEMGACDAAHPPYSTFKIALAVIGFDSGILHSPQSPRIAFNEEIQRKYFTHYNPKKYPVMDFWKKSQNPETWMRYSVLWYSRYITHQLGLERLNLYLQKLNYGTKPVLMQNPGPLMYAWLDNSLQISPREQVYFLEKLASHQLPISKASQENTIKILKTESIEGWQLYAKSGGSLEFGWFVGWLEKEGRRIVFAQYIEKSASILSKQERAKAQFADLLF